MSHRFYLAVAFFPNELFFVGIKNQSILNGFGFSLILRTESANFFILRIRSIYLLGKVDSDVAKTLYLAGQSTPIQEVTCSYEVKFCFIRRENIMIAGLYIDTALGTTRHPFADRLNRNSIFMANMHQRLVRVALKFNILRNQFYFHNPTL